MNDVLLKTTVGLFTTAIITGIFSPLLDALRVIAFIF